MGEQVWPRSGGGGGESTNLADFMRGIWFQGADVVKGEVWTKNGFSWVALEDIPDSADPPNDLLQLPVENYNGTDIAPKILQLAWEEAFPNNEYRVFVIDVGTAGNIVFEGNRQMFIRELNPTVGNHSEIRNNASDGFPSTVNWALNVGRHMFFVQDPYGTHGLTVLAHGANGLVTLPPEVQWAKLGVLTES